MAKNKIGHIEWGSTDLDRSKDFFKGLFDWEFREWNADYYFFNPGEGPGGGFMKVEKVDSGNSGVAYIEVEDIDSTLTQVRKLGGGVTMERTEIPEMGWYAQFTDPDGNVIGLWQGK
jgi:predicted enzyme related to lactoylglutathione lyase